MFTRCKIIAQGFMLGDRLGYFAAFEGPGAKARAREAARAAAEEKRERVDLVQVQDRGNMRFVIAEFEPRWWKS